MKSYYAKVSDIIEGKVESPLPIAKIIRDGEGQDCETDGSADLRRGDNTMEEMKCPKCGNDMKEYAVSFRCRSMECRYRYTKVFPCGSLIDAVPAEGTEQLLQPNLQTKE